MKMFYENFAAHFDFTVLKIIKTNNEYLTSKKIFNKNFSFFL